MFGHEPNLKGDKRVPQISVSHRIFSPPGSQMRNAFGSGTLPSRPLIYKMKNVRAPFQHWNGAFCFFAQCKSKAAEISCVSDGCDFKSRGDHHG